MKQVLLFLFVFISFFSYSQETQYIITNRAAVYETMLTTRESVVKNMENEISLKRFYNSLLVCTDESGNDTCILYTAHEKTFLAYLVGDFSGILQRIKSGNDIHQNPRYAKCSGNNVCPCANEYMYDSLFITAAAILSAKEAEIKIKIENDTKLSEEDKQLLKLHLRSAAAYHRLALFDVSSMKADTDTFMVATRSDTYRDYAAGYLHPQFTTSPFGVGGSFTLGYNLLLGGTGDYFRSFTAQQLNGEFSFKRFFLKADFMFSSAKRLKQNFTYNLMDFTTDSIAFMMGSHFYAGIKVFDNDKIRIVPYAGMSTAAFSLSSNSRNLLFRLSYAGGVDIDYIFYRYRYYNDYKNLFSNPYNKSSWFFRLRIAWQNLPNNDNRFSGSGLFIGGGIGFYINRAKSAGG